MKAECEMEMQVGCMVETVAVAVRLRDRVVRRRFLARAPKRRQWPTLFLATNQKSRVEAELYVDLKQLYVTFLRTLLLSV